LHQHQIQPAAEFEADLPQMGGRFKPDLAGADPPKAYRTRL